jgi:tetratricopeptide (TPR) repeat protein
VLVGNLHLASGDIDAANSAIDRAAAALPDDAMVLAAQARIASARSDDAKAEQLLRRAIELRPLPEYAAALGELLEADGRDAEAREQYALVRATQQLLAANGVDTDIELALFEADHGDPQTAYEQALAAYARRPGVYGADTLAWAAYRGGRIDEAQRYTSEALRLGSADPSLLYHAGMIALAAGDFATAERHLERALVGEAALPPSYATDARAALTTARAR